MAVAFEPLTQVGDFGLCGRVMRPRGDVNTACIVWLAGTVTWRSFGPLVSTSMRNISSEVSMNRIVRSSAARLRMRTAPFDKVTNCGLRTGSTVRPISEGVKSA